MQRNISEPKFAEMRKTVKVKKSNLFKGVLILAALIIFYVLFLMLGQLIPKSLIVDNVQKSYNQLEKEGGHYKLVEGAGWDSVTDALFLNTAVTEYDGSILQRAMANAHIVSEGLRMDAVENLDYALHPDETTEVYVYSRYWAGNTVLYKILLIFTSILGIRLIVLMVTMTLLVLVLFNIRDSLGMSGVIPFMVSIFLGMYIPNAYCLVFSTDIIMMLALMIICDRKVKRSDSVASFCFLFGIAGSLLAYTNYWAFPLIMLGMPLVYVSVLRIKNNDTVK